MGKKEKLQWVVIGMIVVATTLFLWIRESGKEGETRIWIARPESGTKKQTLLMTLDETKDEWS